MRISIGLLAGIISVATFASPVARACITFAPFEMADLREADGIFSGSVIGYEIVSAEDDGIPIHYALITVRTGEVIRGSVGKEVQLYWSNSTFGLPPTLDLADPALFAAMRVHREDAPLTGLRAEVSPARPELLHVLQAPCSTPFMLPYSERGRRLVEKVLKGGNVKLEELYASAPRDVLRNVPAIHRRESFWERADTLVFAAATAIAALAVIAAFWFVRRKRRAKSVP